MGEWRTYKIGDVAQVFDGPHATPRKTSEGPWFLSISSLDQGRLNLSESAHLSEEEFIRWTRRVVPESGDILFSYETRLGDAALMPRGIRACLGRRMGLLRPKRDLVIPQFLLFAYLSPNFQETIRSRKIHGATVDRIPLVDLPKWPIEIPDLAEQEAIVDVLGALDDKLVLNERISASSRQLMEANYLHALQEGSSTTDLGRIADFHNRKRVPLSSRQRAEIPGPYPYYGAAGVVGYVRDFLFTGPHLLVGEDGSVMTESRKPITQYVWGDFWVNNHAHVITGKGVSTEFLAVAMQFTDVSALVTGAVQPKINMRNLVRLEVPIPITDSVNYVAEVIAELTALIRRRSDENSALAALRDTLLPQLMSGKLRVREAERIVEDAV